MPALHSDEDNDELAYEDVNLTDDNPTYSSNRPQHHHHAPPSASLINHRSSAATASNSNRGSATAAVDPPNFHRIQKRRHSFSKTELEKLSKSALSNNNNGKQSAASINNSNTSTARHYKSANTNAHGSVSGVGPSNNSNSSILSWDHPDDESSTFLRTYHKARWFGARFYSHMRPILHVGWINIKSKSKGAIRGKFDVTKLGLASLASLALLFMSAGSGSFLTVEKQQQVAGGLYSTSSSRSASSINGGGGALLKGTSGFTAKGGYQAGSQVPIPIEYANFVELSEFANAVALVRAHRQKAMLEREQQQQQPNLQNNNRGRRTRRRRLDEERAGLDESAAAVADDNNEDGNIDEEINQMNNGDGNTAANQPPPLVEDKSIDEELNQMNQNLEQQNEQSSSSNNNKKSNLLNVNHVPFFWHIPRSGGTTLSTLLATCHSLVQATSSFTSPLLYTRGDDEAFASRFRDPALYVVRGHGEQFVNVDLDSLEGVQRAANGQLIEKELADVVSVPDVRLGSLLFNNQQQTNAADAAAATTSDTNGGDNKTFQGVLFAMFRHPVDRSVSAFYHKQSVKDSVHYDPTLEIYSLADWVNSPSYITDWMTRTLVGKIDTWVSTQQTPFRPPVPLTREDLDVAKEILRRKCVIGLLEEKGESMKRFEQFFGWNADVHRTSLFLFEDEETAKALEAARWKNVKDEECRDRLLHWNWEGKNKHPSLDENGGTGSGGSNSKSLYNLLESKNQYDMELYMYARQLFEEQELRLGFDDDATFFDITEGLVQH